MAKHLPADITRQVMTWLAHPKAWAVQARGRWRAFRHRRVVGLAALVLLALLALGVGLMVAPTPVACEGLCQCWYCPNYSWGDFDGDGDSEFRCDGPCGTGCVGACAYNDSQPHLPGSCSQVPGQGGCGPVCSCRDSDCPAQGGATATPTGELPPPATVTPMPTATPWPDPVIPDSCSGLTEGEVREWTRLIRPTIGEPIFRPDRPVVVDQDPERTGFELHLVFTGGRYEYRTQRLERWCGPQSAGESLGRYPVACAAGTQWHYECPVRCTECYDDPLDMAQIHMRLADSTVAWIRGELQARYPGAEPKEGLPRTWQIAGTRDQMRYEAWWRYAPGHPDIQSNGPLDPGIHGGRIVVSTTGTPKSGPQVVQRPFEVPVYLMDTTIVK